MGANEKFAAAMHPHGPSGVAAVLGAADAAANRVLGYLVQCDTCPQKAIVASQPERDWKCPRCTEATDDDDAPDLRKIIG